MTNFLQAAASYYGLGEANTRKSEVFTDGDEMIYIVELKVSDEDMIAIARRMQEMQDAEQVIQPSSDYDAGKDRLFESMGRVDYDALDPATRSKFGSFARFMAWGGVLPENQDPRFVYGTGEAEPPKGAIQSEGTDGRKVEHQDVPEEESTGLPDAVWVDEDEVTDYQKRFASQARHILRTKKQQYLIQVAMLTPEQRSLYVQQGEKHE